MPPTRGSRPALVQPTITRKQIEDLIRLINERVASTREPISTLRDKIAEKLNSGVSIVSITSFVERF